MDNKYKIVIVIICTICILYILYSIQRRRYHYIIDRYTGTYIIESRPLTIQFFIWIQTILPLWTQFIHAKILHYISHKCQRDFENPRNGPIQIQKYICDYDVDLTEIEKPMREYKTLQEFFQRKLRHNARPIADVYNEHVVTSPADCRMMTFPNISIATKVWIKGYGFTIKKLLRSTINCKYFDNCAMLLCRLSPQDYHRFHFPCSGILDTINHIPGNLFSVSSTVVRSTTDVLSSNSRTITYLRTSIFGDVAIILVGAACTGSIVITAKSGHVNKGQEMGMFAFGGSTVIILFRSKTIQFSDDLLQNSTNGFETLVRMGDKVGTAIN